MCPCVQAKWAEASQPKPFKNKKSAVSTSCKKNTSLRLFGILMLHATFRIWPSYLASLVFHPLRKLLYLALPGICWICIFWAFILKLSYKKVTPTKILIIWLKRKFDFTNSFTKDVIILIVQRRTWYFDFFWDGWRGAHLLPHVFSPSGGRARLHLSTYWNCLFSSRRGAIAIIISYR